MFVNSLNIKEFRGIKYCKGRIKFSNFTVIIGRNNSGKSTILEALSLLPHPEIRNDNTAYLRLGELGSGAEKVIKIMAFLEAFSPKLVIIDDFEARLHPSLVKLFLKWLKEKDWQTIISTHSIDVLYHLVDINPPDTTILQLNKSNEDILGHQILTLEQIEDILDANNDPRLLVDTLGL